MTNKLQPTMRVLTAGDEFPMEVCVDLRPYDRIVWHQEQYVQETTSDGTDEETEVVDVIWVGDFYKAGEPDGMSHLSVTVNDDEREKIIERWEALRATIPYYETKDDHASGGELYALPDYPDGTDDIGY